MEKIQGEWRKIKGDERGGMLLSVLLPFSPLSMSMLRKLRDCSLNLKAMGALLDVPNWC
jgi:hypothetical protein